MKTILLFAAIAAITHIIDPETALSQSFRVFGLQTSSYPLIKSRFWAFDSTGRQLTDFNISEFTVMENGSGRKVLSVSCPPVRQPDKVSVTMSLDISGSMGGADIGGSTEPVELGKMTIKKIVDLLAVPPSEIALQSCDAYASIEQDFTTNKDKFYKALEPLKARGDNDFVEQLLNPTTGLLNIAKMGKYKRVAILYTDAWWGALTPSELSLCKNICQANDIRFYAIIYSRHESQPDGIKKSLQELADFTGGMLFDDILTDEKARQLADEIQSYVQNIDPCTLEWESSASCDTNVNVEVNLLPAKLKSKTEYRAPASSIAYLDIKPKSVKFTEVYPGDTRDTFVTVTANNADVEIYDIRSSHPAFEINPKSFKLKNGESKTLTLHLAPIEAASAYTNMSIDNSLCAKGFMATNFIKKPSQPGVTLKITSPNGGEKFLVGTDTLISWEGVLPEDTVRLEYSTNRGKAWKLVTPTATGLKYIWRFVPDTPGNECLMRASQLTEQDKMQAKKAACIDTIPLSGYREPDVIAIAYSPDGQRLATGSSVTDGIVIWDGVTGEKVDTFIGVSSVSALAYSPDGQRLAAGTKSGDIFIFDALTGQQLKDVHVHQSVVTSLAYNFDMHFLASGSHDHTVKLLDPMTLDCIRTLNEHTDIVTSISFSPGSGLLASGSWDFSLRLWDVDNGICTDTIRTDDKIFSVSFSPDGQKIASGGSTLNVWDAATGANIYTMKEHTDFVTSVAFSPEAQRLASGSEDRTIRLWDMNTGLCYDTLNGHSDYVWSLAFNPDGDRLASGSFDNTVLIWDVKSNIEVLQEDKSDSLWAIVKPVLQAAKDIDLGPVFIGSFRDTVVRKLVNNIGLYMSEIKSYKMTGPDAGDFSVISNKPPFDLPSSAGTDIEFHFKPSAIGIRQAVLNVETADTTLVINIRGRGINEEVSLLTKLVDFGIVSICEKKDSLVHAVVNNSTIDIKVDSIVISGPGSSQFSILSGGGPFILSPGQEHDIALRYKPTFEGRTSSILSIYHNRPGSPLTATLFGEGTGGSIYCSIDSAYAGEKRTISVGLNGTLGECYRARAVKFSAMLKFQSTIMTPVDRSLVKSINGDSAYVEISGSLPPSGVLGQFEAVAGLGSVAESSIEFDSFRWFDDKGREVSIEMNIEPGRFKLLGLCHDGGTRLVNPNGSQAEGLSQVFPNPSKDEIVVQYEVVENGQARIYISNILGEKLVEVLNTDSPRSGAQSRSVDIRNLSPGSYYIIFETMNLCQARKIEVIK